MMATTAVISVHIFVVESGKYFVQCMDFVSLLLVLAVWKHSNACTYVVLLLSYVPGPQIFKEVQ